jgi:CRP/FNR family transcriptional regulator, anaerobic regulatory protein
LPDFSRLIEENFINNDVFYYQMYSKVIEYIQARIMISQEELEKSFRYSQPKTFPKGSYLLRLGEYCRFIGFLNKGMIMNTIIDTNGNEKASNFIYEGCFFTYTEGLASNIPSHKNFIALEECETIILSKENLAVIFKENPKFETLLNQMLAEEIRNLLFNEQAHKTLSLEERYLNLEKQYPNPFQRIPLKFLADYLGVEPPSLSRLRKRLAGKRN